jgi:thiopeptide-type bacteriocin biosynthesis protein
MKFLTDIVIRTPLFPLELKKNDGKIFEEAVYLTSPVLHSEHKKLRSGILSDKKEIQKLNISLYKYHARASSRCTPFGLFAGLSVGRFGSENHVVLNANEKKTLRRQTRLDMNVLCALSQEISKDDCLKPFLKFYPNNSIYQIENYYRYVEYYYNNTQRIHKISKVDFSEYLQLILNEAKKGKNLGELADLLISDDISKDEAINFIDELVTSQLLSSELDPTVTGLHFFDVILNTLQNIHNTHPSSKLSEIIETLIEVKKNIFSLDSNIINDIDSYQIVFSSLKNILPNISETNLFQTDLFKETETSIVDSDIQATIQNALNFLNKISPEIQNKTFDEFKERFVERYENSEIPLLQALDAETGIGYPKKDINGLNDLIDDLFIDSAFENSTLKWNNLEIALHQLITKCIKEKRVQIEISEKDFEGIDFTSKSLPHSVAVMFSVLSVSNNKIAFRGSGSSSAINLLGRFAHGSKDVLNIINSIAEYEEQQCSNNILAEIAHLPEGRVGNILARPSFRKHEIPYLAKSSVDEDFQIDAADLYISLKAGKIILRSKRLNKQIIPRMSNAHNFSVNALPVYHFLCDLQIQYFTKPYTSFDWGVLANQYSFLPRVEYKNVVLSPAKWRFQKLHFEVLLKNKIEDEIIKLFFEFKEKNKLPDLFLIADGDNELLIDTKQTIAILAFVDSLKNRESIILEEFLFDVNNPLVKNTRGQGFTNQCIAIVLNDENRLPDFMLPEPKNFKSQKKYSIGSEWLYYKIYCGVKTADYILTEKLRPIVDQLIENKCIDKWFFIRYNDPENHLRFRLHIANLGRFETILTLINKELEPLIEQGIVFKIQTDTYDRELDRYGDNTIEFAESLFYYDSICCANALNLLDAETGNKIRWLFALRTTDQFLEDFGFSIHQKYDLMENLSQGFFNEHGGKRELKLQLDNKYRKLRKEVEQVLDRTTDKEKEIIELIEILNTRSKNNQPIIDELIFLQKSKNLQLDVNDILCSFIHMMLNRIFMAKQRTNEFVIYDILTRHYKSTIARVKK